MRRVPINPPRGHDPEQHKIVGPIHNWTVSTAPPLVFCAMCSMPAVFHLKKRDLWFCEKHAAILFASSSERLESAPDS
jgi:hypothetical protein